ncbi:flagellin N-terminal helical domain-containing protein [Dongshaea marina]|uniref:flagellin N-terminal helical domain-containing protein n=1 Tax=Dongshaea marina TaxID=2047966 RepID=UPI000D3EC3D2|nr:flagellin [Dongshaea marina]
MPFVVNTNVMSINAQRQLGKSQMMQNQAMERLSSGLRINSAKDDAAGLAISTGMESQIRGLNQAARNANDGISMAQTAEGSMQEMTNILQRMRELAVQSANDTNSASNRASIQKEIDQLYAELDRIATVTQFNGVNLLDGSNSSTSLQIGANTGERLSFSIAAATTGALNLNAVSGIGELNGGRIDTAGAAAVDNGDVTVNGVAMSLTAGAAMSLHLAAFNDVKGLSGVTATAYNVLEGTGNQTGVTDGTFSINGTVLAATGSMTELVDKINQEVGGVTAKVGAGDSLVLSNDDGQSIIIDAGGAQIGLVNDTYAGYLSLTSQDNSAITITTNSVGTNDDIQTFGFNRSTGSDLVVGGTNSGVISAMAAASNHGITSSDGIVINGVKLGDVTGNSAADKAFAINALSSQTDVTAAARTELDFSLNINTAQGASALTINGVGSITLSLATSLDSAVAIINAAGIGGLVAEADATSGQVKLVSASGQDISIVSGSLHFEDPSGTGIVSEITYRGAITLTGVDGKDVTVYSTATSEALKDTSLAKLGLIDQGGNETAVGTGLNVTSVANAENTIERIDDALVTISENRAELGAIQNRLTSTISNLENVSQNLSAANSRIRDADFASETSSLSKSQILQQAGISMLAQANASGQSVLSLLG